MPTRFVPMSSIDRLAANFFGPALSARLDRQIPVDAFQHEDGLRLLFDLPGVREDDVELSIEGRVLTVRAERRYSPNESEHVFLAERPWGRMSRQIVLGDALDTNRVSATYENGVLTVAVPVAADARSRRIEIAHAPTSAVDASSTEEQPAAVEA